MRNLIGTLLVLTVFCFSPCIFAVDEQLKKPLVILIGIDGFKPDYLDRGLTPTLNKLARKGIVSKGLIPAFPSVTFPNHYTLVTGLRPDRHGIVNNRMFDDEIPNQVFHYSSVEAIHNPAWWQEATPIWVSAIEEGKRASTMFWPGSETAINGIKPNDWLVYQHDMTSQQRVDGLLKWLDRPEDTRADFATLYLSEVDSIGHKHGPNSIEVNDAVTNVDLALKQLLDGLAQLELVDITSLVIVSDHGMAEVKRKNIINMPNLLKPFPGAVALWTGAFAGIKAKQEQVDDIIETLNEHEQLVCWQKSKLPTRFKFGTHRRIPEIFCLAQQGWFVTASPYEKYSPVLGMHGYDPALPSMHGLFIASGYRLKQTSTPIEKFENVDVYPLMVELLGIEGEKHQGDAHLLELVQ